MAASINANIKYVALKPGILALIEASALIFTSLPATSGTGSCAIVSHDSLFSTDLTKSSISFVSLIFSSASATSFGLITIEFDVVKAVYIFELMYFSTSGGALGRYWI